MVLQKSLLTSYKEHKTMQLVQPLASTVEPMTDHYFDNSTGFQYANASSTRQQCWRVERTRLVSRPTVPVLCARQTNKRKNRQTEGHLVQRVPSRQTRSAASPLLFVPRLTSDFARRSFSYAAPVIWNSLPTEVISCDSEHSFKRHLKTFL